jgi:hypothetical protein
MGLNDRYDKPSAPVVNYDRRKDMQDDEADISNLVHDLDVFSRESTQQPVSFSTPKKSYFIFNRKFISNKERSFGCATKCSACSAVIVQSRAEFRVSARRVRAFLQEYHSNTCTAAASAGCGRRPRLHSK